MEKDKKNLIIRTSILVVLWVNMILTQNGMNPLPIDESGATELISQALAAISTAWVWWKDNNVTKKARAKKEAVSALEHEGEI